MTTNYTLNKTSVFLHKFSFAMTKIVKNINVTI